MSRIKILILLARILGLTNPAAFSQGAAIEWDTLNEEVRRLYQAGDHKRATVIAEKALKVAEENVGPDHPDVAASLNNLALLYGAQGEYTKAEPLYKRSLAIVEKALGPDHPIVGTSLNNLAGLYQDQGECAEAEPL